MAYVDQPGQTEQDKANQQSPFNQPPTTGTAIGSAGAGDKTPNQPSSSVAPAPFTNLGSYLAVNAPQIQGMSEKVAGQLGQTYDTAKGAVDTGAAAIQNQITGGYAAPNQQLVSQAAANPAEFAANPENVAAFQAQYGNKYVGPASAEVTPDYTTTQGAVQKAVNDAANLGNYGGLQSYLTTNLETNPTQAMSALDTALLNQSPEAIGQINTQAARFPGLTEYFNQALSQQNQNIANAQTAAQSGAQAVQNQFIGEGGVIPKFQSDLDAKVAQARSQGLSERDKAFNLLRLDLSKNLTPEDIALLQKMGISPQDMETLRTDRHVLQDWANTINPATGTPYYQNQFDITGWATPTSPDAQITRANLATPEEYAKLTALQQLTGQDLTGFLNPNDVAMAGTAPKSFLSFDAPGAINYANAQVRAQDKFRIQQAFGRGDGSGLDIDNPAQVKEFVKSMGGYLDNVMREILIPYNDKTSEGYKRAMNAIEALVRQGVYTPPSNSVIKF